MLPGGELIETISREDVFGGELDERMQAFIQGEDGGLKGGDRIILTNYNSYNFEN